MSLSPSISSEADVPARLGRAARVAWMLLTCGVVALAVCLLTPTCWILPMIDARLPGPVPTGASS